MLQHFDLSETSSESWTFDGEISVVMRFVDPCFVLQNHPNSETSQARFPAETSEKAPLSRS